MADICMISAGAGSGKTYKLTQILWDEIRNRATPPHAVLATTFTRKAAAELRERVRARLLRDELTLEANQLQAAFIGTVNAVCGELVATHAFVLGLSPDLRVLDEVEAKILMGEVLGEVADGEDGEALAALHERMPRFEYAKIIKAVVDAARANRISSAGLMRSLERSDAELVALLGEPSSDDLDARLGAALDVALAGLTALGDSTKKNADARRTLQGCRDKLARGMPLSWSVWCSLPKTDVTAEAKRANLLAPVASAAAEVFRHSRLHDDMRRAVRLVFSLAADALRAYEDRKRALGVIDFTDQETHMLDLLEHEEVREWLREHIKVVLVDEFQDTSPLQLELFRRLADVVERSYWVGDPKQAIFGFRGTDSALMNAAVKALPPKERLAHSYRSRPELVRLTSALFAPPFAVRGLAPELTRLEPEPNAVDCAELGPVAELWRLEGDKVEALAAATRDLLSDSSVRVRDPQTGEIRRVRAGDVAVLCFTNKTCAAVADALLGLGLDVVIGRTGLLARPEVRLVHAALRLWLDPADRLAKAELARLVHYPEDGDGFLHAALDPAHAFDDLETVRRVEASRRARPTAGLVEGFDRAVEAVEARQRCLEWGDSAQRLANLDALRGHCVRHANAAATSGAPVTVAGFLGELERLVEADEDHQAVPRRDAAGGAVTVSTWHRAKGLEWPITVLFELEHNRRPDVTAARVVADGAFDFDAPLRGRWLRLWIDPTHTSQKNTDLHKRFDQHPSWQAVLAESDNEMLRLLYVGWTRARDRIVLASAVALSRAERLAAVAGDLEEPPDGASGLVSLTWAGVPLQIRVRDAAPQPSQPVSRQPGAGVVPKGPRAHPDLRVRPSSKNGLAALGKPERFGKPVQHAGNAEVMARLGDCVHAFLAADRPTLDATDRMKLAAGLISRWRFGGALGFRSLTQAGDGLRAWIDGRWPGATWRREWPVQMRLEGGQVLGGICDLVLETDEGLVLIDHKCVDAGEMQALERVAGYGGQLAAYAEALTAATGRPVVEKWFHLPLHGLAVPVEAVVPAPPGGGPDLELDEPSWFQPEHESPWRRQGP